MTKSEYTQISEWMAEKGYFATLLPKVFYNCDVSEFGIVYTEGDMTISIGDWPCGFSVRITFKHAPVSFYISRTADYPIETAETAIGFIRDVIEEIFDEYEMNMRVRFHNAF